MDHQLEKIKKNAYLIAAMFCIVLIGLRLFRLFGDSMTIDTMLFSYDWGFIPRGLIGTIYEKVCLALQLNYMHSYIMTLYGITLWAMTMIVVFLLLLKAREFARNKALYNYTASAFFITTVLTYVDSNGFLRTDMYLMLLSLIGILLLLEDRCLWMLPVLAGICMCIHEGYTFMYANVFLCGLLYKYMTTRKKKYLICCIVDFIVVSALFILFMKVFNYNEAAYSGIYFKCYNFENQQADRVYTDYLQAELLGKNLFGTETYEHGIAIVCTAIYAVLALPVILKAKEIADGVKREFDKTTLLLLFGGLVTLIPDFLLKIDFGRWLLAGWTYLFFMLILVLKDKEVSDVSLKTSRLTCISFALTCVFESVAICWFMLPFVNTLYL